MTTLNTVSGSESALKLPLPSQTPHGKQGDQMGPLRRRWLLTIGPAVLMPLLVASGVGIYITESNNRQQTLSEIRDNAVSTGDVVRIFIRNAFQIPRLVASNPTVIAAAKLGATKAQEQGLPTQPTAALEKKFAGNKLLEVNAELNSYLRQLKTQTGIAEIFFTDRNGFNIAYSNPTSDFVQSDESWWQRAKQEGQAIDEPEFDDSAKTVVIALSESIKDPNSGDFLGVIKAGISVKELNANIAELVSARLTKSKAIQIVDPNTKTIVSTVTTQGADSQKQELIGGNPILEIAKMLLDVEGNPNTDLKETVREIESRAGFFDVTLERLEHTEEFGYEANTHIVLQLEYKDRFFSFATVPETNLVVISSVDASQIEEAARSLLIVFVLTAVTLGTISLVALAYNFDGLINRIRALLQQQQKLTEEQRQEKEALEKEILVLIDEVSGAMEGDLTVRASLDSLETSTIADLFNAIIDSLQEIAVEVKRSTSQLTTFLKENGEAVSVLAEEAVTETEATRNTLNSVEQISKSIQEVAQNATQTAMIANDTYSTVQDSTNAMVQTVDSIISLRNTVGDTAKKMKRLGESSQKISQVVSLIEEIALKTNLLAINASVEASRAGEQGQGFTVVAEQVGTLAEQSAAAAKEIAQIVALIQRETQEVTQAMETSTSQVVDTTRLVESTKQSLAIVLEKSQEINQLMKSISETTISQANTSQAINDLMEQMNLLSEQSSASALEIAQSMNETAEIAQNLEAIVAKFKVTADKA